MKGCSEDILGVAISTRGLDETLELIESWVQDRGHARYFACANPHSIQVAQNDRRFLDALRGADLVVPDGTGIVMASRVLGGHITQRITGADIFFGLNRRLSRNANRSCVFAGSTPETLSLIAAQMAVSFPAIHVKGLYPLSYRPDFGDVSDDAETSAVIEAVNRTRPDVMWVGMSAPKQEKWVASIRDRLDVPCVGPVGALFDFFTGRVRRPPRIVCEAGLEWLVRWAQEPRRLWRRNVVSNPTFALRVLLEKRKVRGRIADGGRN